MPSALRVDQLGGANFGGYHLRNVASLHVGGSALATATFQVTGNALVSAELTASRFVSTVATGTAPLTVTSTTKVANLNADQLDGLDSTDLVTTASKGVANGVAPLNASTKIDTVYLPSTIVGSVEYQGTWDASLGTAPSASPGKGDYYVVNVAGSTSLGGITDWKLGDWAIYNGTAWEKVDNSESVTSVAGRTGAVTLQAGDYPAMIGANGTVAGTRGAVPAPAAADNVNFLRGDGTWAAAGASAAVVASYETAAGQSIPNATFTIIDFGTLINDTDSAVTTGAAWKFTAPSAGYYLVTASIYSETVNWPTGHTLGLSLFKNGVRNRDLDLGTSDGSDANHKRGAGKATVVYLAAGDYIDFRAYQPTGVAITLEGYAGRNWVTVSKV